MRTVLGAATVAAAVRISTPAKSPTNRSSVLVTNRGLILYTFMIPDSVRDKGFRCGRFNNPRKQGFGLLSADDSDARPPMLPHGFKSHFASVQGRAPWDRGPYVSALIISVGDGVNPAGGLDYH
jgi:hypothetical protein